MLFKLPQLVVLLASWLSIAKAVELTGYEVRHFPPIKAIRQS
jgi:hypothetical protein